MEEETNVVKSEAEVLVGLIEKYHEPKLLTVEDPRNPAVKAPILLRPTRDGVEAESVKELLDEYRTEPERKTGTAVLEDLESFCAHVNRFKGPSSALFATRGNNDNPSIQCVLDYHEAGEDGKPRFGRHRSLYKFPLSDEWKAWTEVDDVEMSQAQFAHFIEDRLADVLDPGVVKEDSKTAIFARSMGTTLADQARLLELSRGLRIRVAGKVVNEQNISSGEIAITYETSHQDESGAPLKVPGAFALGIPVFKLGDFFQLPVRLRYRTENGRVFWKFVLYRTEETFDTAFTYALDKARTRTTLELYRGAPE